MPRAARGLKRIQASATIINEIVRAMTRANMKEARNATLLINTPTKGIHVSTARIGVNIKYRPAIKSTRPTVLVNKVVQPRFFSCLLKYSITV